MTDRRWVIPATGIVATALPVAALLAGALFHAAGWTEAGEELRRLFAGVCHQRPERSFLVAGFPLDACARCTGIYLGLFAGALLPIPLRGWLGGIDRVRLKPVLLLFLPAILQPALSLAGILPDAALLRAAGAFPAALAAGFLLVLALVELAGQAGFQMEGVPRAKA